MKNLDEELKNIRESENKPAPTLKELDEIASQMNSFDHCRRLKTRSFISRLLPECYTTFTFTNLNLKNLHEETLFFIFYSLPESDIQIKAYNELISKGFLFSKTLDSFVLLYDPMVVDNKKKSVLIFDPLLWEKVSKDIHFDNIFIGGLESYVQDSE